MKNIYDDNPRKCMEYICWHVKAKGFIYCICCLHGRCVTIPEEQRILTSVLENENDNETSIPN